jgi:SAM-dependent methyltransferase
LGYLTYALSKAGFDATGLDLSDGAIAQAKRRFGDRFVSGDVFEWAKARRGTYDLVMMLELIEHVEDPAKWIEAGRALLKPGGKLLFSTPNRDFYPRGTVWETEAPPVHLWWFSPSTFKYLASVVQSDVEIMDLHECEVVPPAVPTAAVRTTRSPILTKDGRPVSTLRRVLRRVGLLGIATALYEMRAKSLRRDYGDTRLRETLVAIFNG